MRRLYIHLATYVLRFRAGVAGNRLANATIPDSPACRNMASPALVARSCASVGQGTQVAVVGPRRKPIFSFARTGGCQLGNESLRAGRWMLAEERRVQDRRPVIVRASTTVDVNSKPGSHIPASKILLSEGPWKQIPGGVTAADGFQAAGLYGGLRAVGDKPDLALVFSTREAVVAGTFTKNVVAAAPVIFCQNILAQSSTARGVLINAGQANAATGDEGYQDTLDSAEAVAKLLGVPFGSILIESTGVIGKRIAKKSLLEALPKLVTSLSPDSAGSDAAAVAITTTDLVSKSVAIETKMGDSVVKIGGIAKGSGMIHPNMATMLGVITCDAHVAVEVWRPMVLKSVQRSFNQITVDGDSSTNDTLLAFANGAAGGKLISDLDSKEAKELQAALDTVLQGLAKSIASDGEGATCLVEVQVSGARDEADAAIVARSVASSSLTKAAIFGRDPNWGRIACAAGYAGVAFQQADLEIRLGQFLLMKDGQPQIFDRVAASNYLRAAGDSHGTVSISIVVGDGPGQSKAWGCDLSYDYVKINAEYTT